MAGLTVGIGRRLSQSQRRLRHRGVADTSGRQGFPPISQRPELADGDWPAYGRKVTLVWDRNRALEQRLLADSTHGGFGGYNIYRVYVSPDTCKMELLRRFVYHDTLLWHFPDNQTRITFVDPDSAGNLQRKAICRRVDPQNPNRCAQIDSVSRSCRRRRRRTASRYYAIVYAADQSLIQGGFENIFVPDVGQCADPSHPETCCNINNLALNLMTDPVVVTGAPTPISSTSSWCRIRTAGRKPGTRPVRTRSSSAICPRRPKCRSIRCPAIWCASCQGHEHQRCGGLGLEERARAGRGERHLPVS